MREAQVCVPVRPCQPCGTEHAEQNRLQEGFFVESFIQSPWPSKQAHAGDGVSNSSSQPILQQAGIRDTGRESQRKCSGLLTNTFRLRSAKGRSKPAGAATPTDPPPGARCRAV